MRCQSILLGWFLGSVSVLFIAVAAGAEEVPRQPLKSLADYPARGLSPLYDMVGMECKRILAGGASWHVLPRPISDIFVSPDQAPCFEMCNGDTYYNGIFGNAEAIRWAAEQSWDGAFRLVYNSSVLACHDGEFWFAENAWEPKWKHLSKKTWTSYQPIGSSRLRSREDGRHFARDAGGDWWVACEEGLFRLKDGEWERAKISDWPSGPVLGITGDSRGRLIAWASRAGRSGTLLAVRADDKWKSLAFDESGVWTNVALRSDGRAVFVEHSRLVRATPASNNASAEQRNDSQSQETHAPSEPSLFVVGDDRSATIESAPVISENGHVLFAARIPSTGNAGLVRLPSQGPSRWIDFESSTGVQIAAGRNEEFLIFSDKRGLFALAKESQEPRRLADAGRFQPGDLLRGCDKEGRVYFQRGRSFFVFSPEGKSTPLIVPHPLGELGNHHYQPSTRSEPPKAAVNSAGNCWFIGSGDGRVMVLPANETVPHQYDERLEGAQSLWAGQEGAMLIMLKGSVALARPGKPLAIAKSLIALAEEQFSVMFAAAPQSPCDRRRRLDGDEQYGRTSPPASPWLATDHCLWIADESTSYRLRAGAGAKGKTAPPEVIKVCQGDFRVLGPLRSGHLLLADWRTGIGNSSLTSWRQIGNPEGEAAVKSIESPPRECAAGSLERPAGFCGQWWLDGNGLLWLHQGFDRVYRIDSPTKWPMLRDFGPPEFEFPKGFVWGYHSARVFKGYEVAGERFRRSCVPTYVEQLIPLQGSGDKVACLMPDGLALLRFDTDNAREDAVVRRLHVAWREKPIAYIGHSHRRFFFVTRGYDAKQRLVMIELPTADE